jgi:hypothetical protein
LLFKYYDKPFKPIAKILYRMKIIIIKKNGTVDESDYKTTSDLKLLYKKAGFRKEKDFQRRHTWKITNGVFVSVYSKNVGRANTENKYELPPPVDSDLYFGKMVIIKHSEETPTGENCEDLTMTEWKTEYEKLMGGFEDLEDEEESDEEYVAPEDLTKQGYKKDGFVVEDNTIEFNTEDSEEDDEWIDDEDETEDSLEGGSEEWGSSNNDDGAEDGTEDTDGDNEEDDEEEEDEVEKVLVVIEEVKNVDKKKNTKVKKTPKKKPKKKPEVVDSDEKEEANTFVSGSDDELQEEDYKY